MAELIWPDPPAGITDSQTADSETDADLYEKATSLWRSDRAQLLSDVQAVLPALNGNIYKAQSIATAFDQWNQVAAAGSLYAIPEKLDKLHLFTSGKLVYKKSAKNKPEPLNHPFFKNAELLFSRLTQVRAHADYARLQLLRELLEQGPARLRELKRERRVVSYSDLLAEVRAQLTDPARPTLAAELRSRYPAALVDEFQDTDPLQWDIFRTIYDAPDATLFLVGDPKQAIYRFRNADLNVYLDARKTALARDSSALTSLADNQRSSETLIQALNAIFGAHNATFLTPGLHYQSLRLGNKPRESFVDECSGPQPLTVWTLPGGESPLEKADARNRATSATATEIARLLQGAAAGKVRIGERALNAGDIAVVVPTHARAKQIQAELATLSISSIKRSREVVYKSREADELARLLEAILEPSRSGLVRSALATEMLDFDASKILALDDDSRDEAEWVERLSAARDRWRQQGVGVMLRELITKMGIGERLLQRPDGERRLTNLLQLGECLQDAASDHPSPEALMRWFAERRTDGQGDDAAELRLESDRNLVQIVTIHKSKGLEYPIVFCPYLFEGLDKGGGRNLKGVEYHNGSRLCIDFRDNVEQEEKKNLKSIRQTEERAERLRVIYVALTRAVHRLYLVAGPYSKRLFGNPSLSESSRAPLNWLVLDQASANDKVFFTNTHEPNETLKTWDAWAQRHSDVVSLAPLPVASLESLQPSVRDSTAVSALPAPRIPPEWRLGSFSGILRGHVFDASAKEKDTYTGTADKLADGSDIASDDMLWFPRGARAGECVHDLFERIDFTQQAGWADAISQALDAHPPTRSDQPDRALLTQMMHRMLTDVLQTMLPGGFTLSAIPLTKRLTEWEFMLPATRLKSRELTSLLEQHGYRMPHLEPRTLAGYLRGFVDLVFEHEGRFYLLDWKSNFLGKRPADYAPDALELTMQAEGYHLQHILYTVALHHHLRLHLPDYDYARHMGGTRYLFVRGVRPDWLTSAGQALGVYATTPPIELIESLSQLLMNGDRP